MNFINKRTGERIVSAYDGEVWNGKNECELCGAEYNYDETHPDTERHNSDDWTPPFLCKDCALKRNELRAFFEEVSEGGPFLTCPTCKECTCSRTSPCMQCGTCLPSE